jgi:hypothetical protein
VEAAGDSSTLLETALQWRQQHCSGDSWCHD